MKTCSPHRTRRTNIHVAILLIALLGILLAANISCTPQRGCYATRHMAAGYSLNLKRLIDKYGGSWVYCKETGKVCVFNPEGKLIGYYTQSK